MSRPSLLQSSFDYQVLSCDFQHPPILEDSFFQSIFNGFPKPRFHTIDRGVVYLFINFLRIKNPQLESESINHFSIVSKKYNRRQIKLTADENTILGSEVRFDHPIIFPVSFETDNKNCLRKFATLRLEVRRSEASRIIELKTFRVDIGSLINNYRTNCDINFSQSMNVPTQWIYQKVCLVDIGVLNFAFAFRSANDESRGRSLAESHLRYMNEIVTNALSTPRPALAMVRDPVIAVDVSQHDQSIVTSSVRLPSASGKEAVGDAMTNQHNKSVSVSSFIPPSLSGEEASAYHKHKAVGDAITDQHNQSVKGLSVEGIPVEKKVGEAMTNQNDQNLIKSDELDARVSTKQMQFSILKNPSARNVPVESGLQRQLSSAPPTRTFIIRPPRMWEFSRRCFECKYTFRSFLWRHHCRHCGLSYCYRCSDHFIDLKSPMAITHVINDENIPNPARLCNRCNEEWHRLIRVPQPLTTNQNSLTTKNVSPKQGDLLPAVFSGNTNSVKVLLDSSSSLLLASSKLDSFNLKLHQYPRFKFSFPGGDPAGILELFVTELISFCSNEKISLPRELSNDLVVTCEPSDTSFKEKNTEPLFDKLFFPFENTNYYENSKIGSLPVYTEIDGKNYFLIPSPYREVTYAISRGSIDIILICMLQNSGVLMQLLNRSSQIVTNVLNGVVESYFPGAQFYISAYINGEWTTPDPQVENVDTSEYAGQAQSMGLNVPQIPAADLTYTFVLMLRQSWQFSHKCTECQFHFDCCHRRHHCRHCGLSYCSRCSDHFIDLVSPDALTHVINDENIPNPARLCNRCNEEWHRLIRVPQPRNNQVIDVNAPQMVLPDTQQNQETEIGQSLFRLVYANNREPRPTLDKPPDVFFSLRFNDAALMAQAQLLRNELKKKQIDAIIIDTLNSRSILREVSLKLKQSKMAIIFGTADYGEDTQTGYSSFDELSYILDYKKPFFLIKMCDDFQILETQFRLHKHLMSARWDIGQPIPDNLVQQISRHFNRARLQ